MYSSSGPATSGSTEAVAGSFVGTILATLFLQSSFALICLLVFVLAVVSKEFRTKLHVGVQLIAIQSWFYARRLAVRASSSINMPRIV